MLRGPHGARSSHSFSPEASLCVIFRWLPLPLLAVQGHMLTAHLLGARLGLLSLRQSGVSTHIPWSRRSFWEKSVRPSASSMGAVPFAPRALSPPPSPALSFMKMQSQPPHPTPGPPLFASSIEGREAGACCPCSLCPGPPPARSRVTQSLQYFSAWLHFRCFLKVLRNSVHHVPVIRRLSSPEQTHRLKVCASVLWGPCRFGFQWCCWLVSVGALKWLWLKTLPRGWGRSCGSQWEASRSLDGAV